MKTKKSFKKKRKQNKREKQKKEKQKKRNKKAILHLLVLVDSVEQRTLDLDSELNYSDFGPV